MKLWIDLIKYRSMMYIKSSKFVVPILIFGIFKYFTCTQKPITFIPDAVMSSVMVGYIMMWIAFSYYESEDNVTEQVLFCNVNYKKVQYYGSKLAFLFIIGFGLSLFGAIYPFFVNAVNGLSLFTRQLAINDFLGSFFIHMINVIIAIATSYIFQPRILKNRKLALLSILLVATVSLCRNVIISELDLTKYILWIFPPINQILLTFHNLEYFTFHSLEITFLYGSIYSCIILTLGLFVVDKQDF